MMAELTNLRGEAAIVRQENNQVNKDYLAMKQGIQRQSKYGTMRSTDAYGLQATNGHRSLNPQMPSYLRDAGEAQLVSKGGMPMIKLDSKLVSPMDGDIRVESARVSLDRFNDG
jgi:hypothetical protein